MMMLLYWISCWRTFCSSSIAFATFWQIEQKTAPCLDKHVTLGCTALQPSNPLRPLKGKKAVLRMEPRKPPWSEKEGRQLKFCCRAVFRSLMAESACLSRRGSMFNPEKRVCPLTVITNTQMITHFPTPLFSIRINYKVVSNIFDLCQHIKIKAQKCRLRLSSITLSIYFDVLLINTYYFFISLTGYIFHDGCPHNIEIELLQLKQMTTWLGDKYEGEYKEGWYHGYGRLQLENGVIYEGQFVKGQYHGEGKLIYPNGGYYKAQWVDGKMTSGEYIFNDNLNFEKDNWKHCINDDRRFYQEYLHGIKPSGATQQTREDKPHNIPTGTYDTGDGYYEPVKSIIYSYEGKIFRTPTEQEVKFIIEKCRYVPKAVDIDGSKDRVIKKVLEMEGKK